MANLFDCFSAKQAAAIGVPVQLEICGSHGRSPVPTCLFRGPVREAKLFPMNRFGMKAMPNRHE
jgi:hypothetical protein